MGKCLKISKAHGLGLIAAMLMGCAVQSLVISPPAWDRLESGMYDTSEGRVFYGIGHASGVQNPTLLRAAADNHARKELAAVLDRFVAELARSADVGTDPAWAALPADEQRQTLGIIVRKALQRAVISDHWRDAQEPRLLALCRLDLAAFKQVLADSAALEKSTRTAMWAEAEAVHLRLSQKF